jgi:hypothetical protein
LEERARVITKKARSGLAPFTSRPKARLASARARHFASGERAPNIRQSTTTENRADPRLCGAISRSSGAVRALLSGGSMRAKALLFALAVTAFSYTGCAAPTGEEEETEGSVSAQSLEVGKANTDGFKDIPSLTPAERDAILARYATIPHQGVRQELFEKAVLYYDTNVDRIDNKAFMSVVDFQKHSGKRRFFILDMNGGPVRSHVVAHGVNSDPNDTGIATLFSNVVGSFKSSLGFYVTAETYTGSHGLSLKLDGLSSTNNNVRERVIVIHSAAYVDDDRMKQGNSQGCLAFSEEDKPRIVADLKNGSIIYASN